MTRHQRIDTIAQFVILVGLVVALVIRVFP